MSKQSIERIENDWTQRKKNGALPGVKIRWKVTFGKPSMMI